MSEQERRDQAKHEHRRNACPLCWGDFWQGFVKTPHHPDCPKANDPLPTLPVPRWNYPADVVPPPPPREADPDPDRDDFILGGR